MEIRVRDLREILNGTGVGGTMYDVVKLKPRPYSNYSMFDIFVLCFLHDGEAMNDMNFGLMSILTLFDLNKGIRTFMDKIYYKA